MVLRKARPGWDVLGKAPGVHSGDEGAVVGEEERGVIHRHGAGILVLGHHAEEEANPRDVLREDRKVFAAHDRIDELNPIGRYPTAGKLRLHSREHFGGAQQDGDMMVMAAARSFVNWRRR